LVLEHGEAHARDELLNRAGELNERASIEADPAIRELLASMANSYVQLAETERQMASHPVSIASVGELFKSRNGIRPCGNGDEARVLTDAGRWKGFLI
jgi:hypothetical protein